MSITDACLCPPSLPLFQDGYQNNAMTMINVLFQKRYGTAVYNSEVSTRISNALLVGAVLGQVTVGVICDRIGRKSAIGEHLARS